MAKEKEQPEAEVREGTKRNPETLAIDRIKRILDDESLGLSVKGKARVIQYVGGQVDEELESSLPQPQQAVGVA